MFSPDLKRILKNERYQAKRSHISSLHGHGAALFSCFFCRLVFNRRKCCCDMTDNLFIFPHPVVLHKTTRVSGAGEEAEKKLAWMKAERRLPRRTAFPRPGKTKQKVSVLFCFFFFLAFYPALVTVSFVAGGKQFLERALHSTRSPFLSQTAAEAGPSYKCSFYAPLIQQPLKH